MTTDSMVLDQLCGLHGIATEYTDDTGNARRVPVTTKRSLLAAMGLDLDETSDLLSLLEDHEAHGWQRLLPPVLVGRHGESMLVPLTVTGSQVDSEISWRLFLENGEQRDGRVRPSELNVTAVYQGNQAIRYAFPLPVLPDIGYHRLELLGPDRSAVSMALIVAPGRCYRPEALSKQERLWGPAFQLYALRSQRNWGIGDLTDLRSVLAGTAELGAAVVGLNPLHALFPRYPAHIDPYNPSSRLYLNVLYLDVEAIPDFSNCPAAQEAVGDPQFQARLRALRANDKVDYEAVTEAKLTILETLYRAFRDQHLNAESARGNAFRAFLTEEGEALHRQSLFDALHEHLRRDDSVPWNWTAWPEPYRNPNSAQVAAFAETHRERLEFYAYLQWQLAEQLEAAARQSLESNLGIGLLQDLAVSANRYGADAWASQDLYPVNVSLGAPPDECFRQGQDWGLAPINPICLFENAYQPFIDLLRKAMRHNGALRITQIMGLSRLFWIPAGGAPADGTYVAYPFDDLLAILALESQRHRCLIIGDHPGSARDAVSEALSAAGVFAQELFYLAKKPDGDFHSPDDFAAQTLVAISDPDLPTLNGYWQGVDLILRDKLDMYSCQEIRDAQIVERAQDRARLRVALERQGLLPADVDVHAISIPEMTPELTRSIHRYLARSPAQLMLVRMEDVFAQVEQTNLPGIGLDQYPNWQYRLPLNLEDWFADQRLLDLANALREERGVPKRIAPLAVTPSLVKPRIPDVTYRLQFHSGFTFNQATAIVPYLQALGISHCYASPYLSARPGSSHGYDIIDHNTLNPEIGGREDFERFSDTLKRNRMGQILDVVPNHMGVMGSDNAWWLDVLENGPAALHASFFDIDWQPFETERRDKILLPVLGDHYGVVLENGELQLIFDAATGTLRVQYYQHLFPIDPREYPRVLGNRIEQLEARLGCDDQDFLVYQSLLTAFGHLPGRHETNPEKAAERQRDKEIHKRRLRQLCERSPDILWFVEENVRLFNGTQGMAQSFDTLHGLLEAQAYRLSFWRVASDSINYRRFFDINDLAGLRMEHEAVFRETHALVLDLLAQGRLDGLRIDHPDGLYDPRQYFQRLQEALVVPPAPVNRGEADDKPLYVVVEKILESYERLPPDWPVHGTTGYDFANLLNALLVDAGSEQAMSQIYADFIGEPIDFEEMLYECKKLIMESSLASELTVLATEISRLAGLDRRTRDFSPISLWRTLTEIVAWFPVYRTYITPAGYSEDDKHYVDWAVSKAKKRSQAADIGIFDFVRDVLLTVIAEGKPAPYRERVIAFAMKFQQYTGPLMAKGLEDTCFYRYNRLTSLNEVGGDPRRFGLSVSGFHYANQDRAKNWPHAMLATSTHDSKRSEDVRARINVLSELSQDWEKHLKRWCRINRTKKRLLDEQAAPSTNDEYLIYQTLIGAWPLEEMDEAGRQNFCTRIEEYMLKAVKEAKVHSSWINPNPAYEEAVVSFVRALLEPEKNRFLDEFLPLQQRVARFGLFNSLSQTLLKLTSPGVPDIYQGNEIWDFSLVDPDNRRPVNYGLRQRLLRNLENLVSVPDTALAARVRSLLDTLEDGRVKLYLTWKTLQHRRHHQELYRGGEYAPVSVVGSKADHVCAFARRYQDTEVIVVVPRLWAKLLKGEPEHQPLGKEVWEDTRLDLPASETLNYRNLFTGEILPSEVNEGATSLPLAGLLRHFPVALLMTS